jgi:amphiphysin
MLLKMENELELATQVLSARILLIQEFQMHDERLKEMIPSIMETISAFFAPMLTTVYSVQSDLYQHLYASVYEYATSQGLVDIDNVVEEFSALYEQIRQRAETEIKSLRDGKAARIPMGETGAKPGIFARKSSSSMMPSLNRTSSNKPTSTPPPSYSPQLDTRKSSSSLHKSPPLHPSTSPPMLSPNPGGRQNSYEITSNGRTPSSSINALEAKKKKPPPPPPPKPSLSPKPEFVIAKYDFAGENQGDLAFKVGDRIKIIKKTDSLEDWWEGELNGMRGMFPRNYCD